MPGQLLELKITPPPLQPRLLPRPKLLELLNSELMSNGSFHRKLTLVTAPAGYGKTSIVRQWLAEHSERVAWYSLDDTDSDPSRFWLYFLSALGKVAPVGQSTLQTLSAPSLSQMSIDRDKLIGLLNELANLETPLFLVLDDFHLIEDQTVSDNLAFLIERLPPTVHIVVITRYDPDWPLAHWQAKRHLLTLSQSYLRFSDQEAATLFNDVPLGRN
ncbi:MAG: hypothetical protein FH749_11160 [Firmicutes bacterium]|nr:hypothetical protein [Bacillota bacterium]